MSNYWSGHAEGMSSAFGFADIAARAERNQADDAINQWSRYADGLQAQLNQSKVETIATSTALEGEAAITKQLKMALEMFAPDHPFLQNPSLLADVKAAAATKYANARGFRYNPATEGITRVR